LIQVCSCVLVFLFAGFASAEEKALDSAKEQVEAVAQKVENVLQNTRTRREQNDYLGLINYAPLDLIIPSKIGLTLGLLRDADTSWELEYLRGSVSVPFLVDDLGSMTDQRISLIRRSYFGGNSFNIGYGLSYYDFKVNLGSDILSRLTSGSVPQIDLIQIQALGLNFSLGNRWHFDHNITLGVDWFSWSQPLVVTNEDSVFLDYVTNPQDRDDVDTAIKLTSYFPRFSFFKIQLGILF
jgi:hypothetical protein